MAKDDIAIKPDTATLQLLIDIRQGVAALGRFEKDFAGALTPKDPPK